VAVASSAGGADGSAGLVRGWDAAALVCAALCAAGALIAACCRPRV
jgi:hypothetical protein